MNLLNKIPFFLVLFVLLGLGACGGAFSSRPDLRDVALDPVQYTPPTPEIWKLPNGLSVYFVYDDELPLVNGSLYLRGGTLWEPRDSPGVVAAMGSQLRLGGAGDLKPRALDLEIEKLAASLSSSFGGEYGTVSFQCLSQDVDRVFSLLSDVVLRPRFDEARLSLWRSSALEDIRRRKDDPETMAGISRDQILYKGTPYGQVITSKDIADMKRLDLLRMHRKFVRPNGAILVISGSIQKDRLKKLVRSRFGNWEPRRDALGPPPPVPHRPSPGIYFIEKPVSQSSISIGQLSVARHSPDQYALNVFNRVFGMGGFDSRLMKRVRTELGYVYGIYGATHSNVVRGKNLIEMQTKSETTVDALVAALEVLADLQAESPRADELEAVRQAMQSSFIFRFDSPQEAADRQALLKIYGYPEDYDMRYLERVFSIDGTEVRRVARKWWRADDFVIVVVGSRKAYNLLSAAVKSPPAVLDGYRIYRGSFDEYFIQTG